MTGLGIWLAISTVWAGSGPWALGPRDRSVYVGAESQHIGHLANSEGSRSASVVPVDDGIDKLGFKVIGSRGLLPGIEIEGELPWYHVEAVRQDGPLCTALGPGSCVETQGIGVLSGRIKGGVADELAGAPVTAAVGASLRLGQLTNAQRERVTNLGEGTTDLGAFASVGRAGGVGGVSMSGWAEVGWRHRSARTEVAGEDVPGPELTSDGEFLLGGGSWSLGPSYTMLWRYRGVDLEEVDLTDVDRFSSLRTFSVRAGGKLILRASDRTDFVFAAFTTAYAVNNPTDVWLLGAGLSLHPGSK